ncbi:MerR family transcriptional regulator [Novosphingobium beihaiensis]|uniref:MerR family transcriptional regulator n=1 Tax=Novosphingobium beihaiensis TaxID=2930389 RepID=A0ABT0BN56_9SPHN|nr:MerR family transcriptional regulator [Novosphingobium beihaiensis]MCJ2186149.1 MerR family transcriptional regulator [Novosphingobium beihaiensis]
MSGLPTGPVFHDGKDADALRTIGEVTQALGIRQHVLRYWEEQFPALKPVKRSGGRRYYRPADVALIAEIDRLVHREGYTLRGACKAISERSAPPAPSVTVEEPASRAADIELRERLVAIRRDLAEALAAA